MYSQTFAIQSDRRLKENIKKHDKNDSLTLINKLQHLKYNYIVDKNKQQHTGFVAQDVQLIDPDSVTEATNHDGINYLSINYNNLFVHNIAATQQLSSRVDIIETFINANMNGNIPTTPTAINPLDDILARLSQMEATIADQAKIITKLKKQINNI